jgi:hypothetical protein
VVHLELARTFAHCCWLYRRIIKEIPIDPNQNRQLRELCSICNTFKDEYHLPMQKVEKMQSNTS